ncbi:MAG: hypothetical protein HOD60_06895 [Candidatus Nitrosopelagicus sp.]|nr:hypothetical protein [Candidatus Nitrosopelagicus sp.]
MSYNVSMMHDRIISELVEAKKFKDLDDFMKSAVEILLAWESKHPEDCMEIMQGLKPFSTEQELFMKQSMKPEEIQRHFGSLDIDQGKSERSEQITLAQTDYDYLKLQGNYQNTINYIKNLKISTPENMIPYDGHPMLSGGYSRLLPVKISVAVLCHLLESSKDNKVGLKELRVHAYDIAEEIGGMITKYEKENDIPRNNKKSTGLPKKSNDEDEDKINIAQMRVKDLFIGKIRNSRTLKKRHFEGALSALGLAYAFEEEGEIFVSLTELGKEFFLIENPIIQKADYSQPALSDKEADFILNKLIPQRELEKLFVETSIDSIKKFKKSKEGDCAKENLEKLEKELLKTVQQYAKKNPDIMKKYNIIVDADNEKAEKKISQWRLSTMGRLAEMNVVKWTISPDSISEYVLN